MFSADKTDHGHQSIQGKSPTIAAGSQVPNQTSPGGVQERDFHGSMTDPITTTYKVGGQEFQDKWSVRKGATCRDEVELYCRKGGAGVVETFYGAVAAVDMDRELWGKGAQETIVGDLLAVGSCDLGHVHAGSTLSTTLQ